MNNKNILIGITLVVVVLWINGDLIWLINLIIDIFTDIYNILYK